MIVVRRAVVGFAVAGLVLLGSAAHAQDADPCAPGPDGSVPEMCQGAMVPEPDPDPGTDPCPAQPVEPGDGVVTDPGTEEPSIGSTEPAIAVGEPNPNLPPEEPGAEGEVKPEPVTEPDAPVSNEAPDVIADPGIICAFGAPVSAPVADGAPVLESAGGGAVTAVDTSAPATRAAAQLPRTGPRERLAVLGAFGAALLLLGGGALLTARRRAEA